MIRIMYKARDSRKLVMDSVLEDINYAVANIPKEIQLNSITKVYSAHAESTHLLVQKEHSENTMASAITRNS